MRGITQILITMTTEPRPCRGTAKILATATPDGGIANFLLPVTEHLHTSREHLPKARKPASIADTRFEQKREQRQTCCDQCNHLKVGNQAGAFYHRQNMPPAGERQAAWERGDWDASWYCTECYMRYYNYSYEAVCEKLGFTGRAGKKARYAKEPFVIGKRDRDEEPGPAQERERVLKRRKEDTTGAQLKWVGNALTLISGTTIVVLRRGI